jgi:hypothetical protein
MKTKLILTSLTIALLSSCSFDPEADTNSLCECYDKAYTNLIEKHTAYKANRNESTRAEYQKAKLERDMCKIEKAKLRLNFKKNPDIDDSKYRDQMRDCEKKGHNKYMESFRVE